MALCDKGSRNVSTNSNSKGPDWPRRLLPAPLGGTQKKKIAADGGNKKQVLFAAATYVPWSKVAILGMVIPPLIGILIIGSLDPATYCNITLLEWVHQIWGSELYSDHRGSMDEGPEPSWLNLASKILDNISIGHGELSFLGSHPISF